MKAIDVSSAFDSSERRRKVQRCRERRHASTQASLAAVAVAVAVFELGQFAGAPEPERRSTAADPRRRRGGEEKSCSLGRCTRVASSSCFFFFFFFVCVCFLRRQRIVEDPASSPRTAATRAGSDRDLRTDLLRSSAFISLLVATLQKLLAEVPLAREAAGCFFFSFLPLCLFCVVFRYYALRRSTSEGRPDDQKRGDNNMTTAKTAAD